MKNTGAVDIRRRPIDIDLASRAMGALDLVLTTLGTNPEAAIRNGNRSRCACCGRHMSEEASLARGVGPECLNHMGAFFQPLPEIGRAAA